MFLKKGGCNSQMKKIINIFTRRFVLLLFVCGVFCGSEVCAAGSVASASTMFPDLQMEDQFRVAHTNDSFFSGPGSDRPLVLIAGDQRRTDDNIRAWVNLLKGPLGDRVRYVGMANLRGLPFFVSKNSVRSSLKKKLPDVQVLCDWNGDGFKKFAFVRRQTNVQVYSRTRALVGSVTGKPDDQTASAVISLVERALSAK